MLSSSYRGRKVAKVRKREDKPVRPVPLGGTHGMTMLRRYAIVCIVNSAQSSAGSARGGLRNRGSQWTAEKKPSRKAASSSPGCQRQHPKNKQSSEG
mmetsp:Transcript_106247/g.148101  ORF Transcript_106247/g.148101 Transcript_106247/m.148101 type:complete len:97 (-) Transcript_106247:87-377(-)